MSRSKKGTKAPGYDYWGKRGSEPKDVTKKGERAKERDQISRLKKDPYLGTPDTERDETVPRDVWEQEEADLAEEMKRDKEDRAKRKV